MAALAVKEAKAKAKDERVDGVRSLKEKAKAERKAATALRKEAAIRAKQHADSIKKAQKDAAKIAKAEADSKLRKEKERVAVVIADQRKRSRVIGDRKRNEKEQMFLNEKAKRLGLENDENPVADLPTGTLATYNWSEEAGSTAEAAAEEYNAPKKIELHEEFDLPEPVSILAL